MHDFRLKRKTLVLSLYLINASNEHGLDNIGKTLQIIHIKNFNIILFFLCLQNQDRMQTNDIQLFFHCTSINSLTECQLIVSEMERKWKKEQQKSQKLNSKNT